MALVKFDELGRKYILPGLYLEDCGRPTKKIHGYKSILTKGQVEGYLNFHLDRLAEARASSEDELTALVHDLRHLSSSIYHSAIELEDAAKRRSWLDVRETQKTIIASQTMLKVRIDYLDFSNSVDRFDEVEKIPVYRRVDKVIRCFRADARHKDIELILMGKSYRLTEGPNIFDIVPYTLIENAIKYSPRGNDITVHIQDVGEVTRVSIQSLGPRLEADESEKLFQRGFRGKNAINVRKTGTGMGLSVAQSVVDAFKGTIALTQEGEPILINQIPFSNTIFEIIIPTSGEAPAPRRRPRSSRVRTRA